MSSAKSVAKELVRLSMSGPVPDPLTYYRLQCLVYYAQAWSLVLRGSELFPEEMEGLVSGPIVLDIQSAQNAHQAWPFVRPESFDQEPNLDEEDEALFLRHLWAAYADLSPSGLFAAVQGEPPFLKAKKEQEMGGKGLIRMNDLDESFRRRPSLPGPLVEYARLRQERERQADLAILSSPPLDVEAIWKGCQSVTPSAGKR
jgi:uncharacterized phage-associated protein